MQLHDEPLIPSLRFSDDPPFVSQGVNCVHNESLALPLTTFLLLKVLNEEEVLKIQLGSALITVWIVFYCGSVLVSAAGLSLWIDSATCGVSYHESAGLWLKAKVFVDLQKRRSMEFDSQHGDEYTCVDLGCRWCMPDSCEQHRYTNKHRKRHSEATKAIR